MQTTEKYCINRCCHAVKYDVDHFVSNNQNCSQMDDKKSVRQNDTKILKQG